MTTAVAAPATRGLFTTDGEAVALVGVQAEATLRDHAARVVLRQRYRNDEALPIEAVYRFPLDEGSAVCGFEAEIEGRRIVAKVEERGKAFERYDEALAGGHGAYLLEAERDDVFTVSVGALPPGREVVLQLTLVLELPLEGDDIRFTLPTTLAPRYAPAEDREGPGETPAESVSAPWALAVPYGLDLTVRVETSAPLRGIESPTHKIALELGDKRAVVRLAERETAMDRDFVLKVALAEDHRPRAVVERAEDGRAYALVSFRPAFEARPAPADVVFLVDRSGSMEGSSIEEAKNALALSLRSLRPGCTFNIVGFGSSFEALFPESCPYDDESFARAKAFVERIDADLGGTEILPALEAVLKAPARRGVPRQVFLLTDGQVSNDEAVIALVRRHAGRARVFTFGIGAGASHHLVKGVARAGEGEAEMIAPGERIEAKVLLQLGRALAPAVADVTVDWGGLEVEGAPHVAPPVFASGRVLVYGRIADPRPATVTLRGRTPDGEVSFAVPLEVPETGDVSAERLLATLWARRAIRDLEEGGSPLHGRRGSRQKRGRAFEDKVQAEILRLGTEFGLVSRHTSFVAVEERENPAEGEIVLRPVPVAITRDWHGLSGQAFVACNAAPALLRCAAPASFSVDDMAMECSLDDPQPPCEEASPILFDSRLLGGALARSAGHRRPLDHVVSLQRLDGAWEPSQELFGLLGLRKADVDAALGAAAADDAPASADPAERDRREVALATALALLWLGQEQSAAQDEWVLLARKALDWLERMPEGRPFWLDLARTVARH